MLELFYMSDHEISEDEASERLGVVGRAMVFSLLDAVCAKDSSRALEVISEAYDNSKDLGVLCSELSDTLRDILVTKYCKTPEKLIDATGSDIDRLRAFATQLSDEKLVYCSELCEDIQNRLSRAVFSRRTIIETGLIKMCEEKLSADNSTLLSRIAALEEKLAKLSAGTPIVSQSAPVQPTPVAPPAPTSAAPAESEYEAPPLPDEPPMPSDDDMPFDGPYTEPEKPKTMPKPIAPRPLAPRPIAVSAPASGAEESSGDRKLMDCYAEFVEETEACDKMAASMLEGGRGYIVDGNICELELVNPIAPMLLSRSDKAACIESALTKVLGFTPRVKIKFVKGKEEIQRQDLSSLLP
jgi:DNA polymerase III gamma/tau subunit